MINESVENAAQLRQAVGSLSPDEFEQYVLEAFERLGYDVRQTQQSRDSGIDGIVAGGSFTAGIQIKRYGYETKVSGPDVQQYAGVKSQHDFDVFAIVTSSSFTAPAITNARELDIHLIDSDGLYQIIADSLDPFRDVADFELPNAANDLPRDTAARSHTFSGDRARMSYTTEPIELVEGLTKVEFTTADAPNGTVKVLTPDDSPVQDSHTEVKRVVESSDCDGSEGVFQSEGGEYTFDIFATSPWELTVRQPAITELDTNDPARTISGVGQTLLGPFEFDGRYETTLVTAESEPVQASLETVQGAKVGTLINASDPYDTYETVYEFDQLGFITVFGYGSQWEIQTKQID